MEDYAWSHLGERGAGDDLDLVAHAQELSGEVVDINTLATAVRISPIAEEANSHIFYPGAVLGRANYSMFVSFVWLDLLRLSHSLFDYLLSGSCPTLGANPLHPIKMGYIYIFPNASRLLDQNGDIHY